MLDGRVSVKISLGMLPPEMTGMRKNIASQLTPLNDQDL